MIHISTEKKLRQHSEISFSSKQRIIQLKQILVCSHTHQKETTEFSHPGIFKGKIQFGNTRCNYCGENEAHDWPAWGSHNFQHITIIL